MQKEEEGEDITSEKEDEKEEEKEKEKEGEDDDEDGNLLFHLLVAIHKVLKPLGCRMCSVYRKFWPSTNVEEY